MTAAFYLIWWVDELLRLLFAGLLLHHRVQHRAQLYEYEMALLANLTPERVEEATTLVPSLKVSQ